MKLQSLEFWPEKPELEGLLFFAQTINEMLFHYTLDSFKAPALNTRLLCYEANIVVSDIEKGNIKVGSLRPIIEEIQWSLLNDSVAQKLIGQKYSLYFEAIDINASSLNQIKIRLNSLIRILDQDAYFNEIKNQLVEAVKSCHEKDNIRKLTRIFITDLLNSGYNQNYVYFITNRFFFEGKNGSMNDPEQILDYLNLFNFEEIEFDVVFKASRLFLELKESLEVLKIEISERLEIRTQYKPEERYIQEMKEDEVFLVRKGIKAVDHHGAREKTEYVITKISNFFCYFHHKQRPKWSPEALVCRIVDNNIAILDNDTVPIFSQSDINPAKAAQKVKEILSELDLEDTSFYRFDRAIDLHSVALETAAVENQLLDLWATFESLLPKAFDDGKDRIQFLCDCVNPILRLNYITRLVRSLIYDLLTWNRSEVTRILKKVPEGKELFEKVAALLALSSNDNLRNELFSKLHRFPLLKNRIYTLSKSFSSVDLISELLDSHSKRVTWHIMRIYRTRNLIIHTGQIMPYTVILVENLHTYLDQVLEQIERMAISDKQIKSIEEVILETKFKDQHHKDMLKKAKKTSLDSSNYLELLFGSKS